MRWLQCKKSTRKKVHTFSPPAANVHHLNWGRSVSQPSVTEPAWSSEREAKHLCPAISFGGIQMVETRMEVLEH